MKEFGADSIRNLGFFGHGGSGKTSICEALLFTMKQNTRLGSVDDGTSLMDYDEDEVKRKIGINLSLGYGEHRECLVNLVDAPGYADFMGNAICALRAIDNGVLVVDAVAGVEVGTEMAWRWLDRAGLPRAVFVNKLGRENTDFYSTAEELRRLLGTSIAPIYLPIGRDQNLRGVVDLLNDRAYLYQHGTRTEGPVPAEVADKVTEWKERLVEAAADADEALMEKFLEGTQISADEMKRAVRAGIRTGVVHPLLCGDAREQIGVDLLLDLAVDVLAGPTDLPDLVSDPGADARGATIARTAQGTACAFVFKTVSEAHVGEMAYVRVFSGILEAGGSYLNSTRGADEKLNQMFLVRGRERTEVNRLSTGMIGALVKLKDTRTGDTISDRRRPVVLPQIEFPRSSISVAIVPRSKADEERVSSGLAKLRSEDPTFSYEYDQELSQQLLHGTGELHLDIIIGRLKNRFEVEVDTVKPRIPFRETITRKAEAQGRHKKQTGGRGQFGDAYLRIEPLERGAGFEFVDAIKGGAIPGKFIPAVEKGVIETMQRGILAGYRMIDIRATVYDGSFHPVDSSDIAFKLAGALAFKNACERAGLVLLEPILNVDVAVPEAYTGDVMGDLNSRRGRIMGMETQGGLQVIRAQAPQAEMYKYSNTLRSITQGRGFFTMDFAHYEEVPRDQASRIIEEAKRAKEGS